MNKSKTKLSILAWKFKTNSLCNENLKTAAIMNMMRQTIKQDCINIMIVDMTNSMKLIFAFLILVTISVLGQQADSIAPDHLDGAIMFSKGYGQNLYTVGGTYPGKLSSKMDLSQNYPNPFNPTTKINYPIPQSNFITLKIYNILGQQVVTLFQGKQRPHNYTETFDATKLASGIYLYRLEIGGTSITKKTGSVEVVFYFASCWLKTPAADFCRRCFFLNLVQTKV